MPTQYITRLLIYVCLTFFSSQLPAQEPDAETKEKIAQCDQLEKQANDAVTANKLDEATALFERVYSLEQSIFGEAHEELIGTLDALVQLAELNQDDDALVEYLERQLAVTQKVYGQDDYRTQDAVRAVDDVKQRASFTPEQKALLAQANSLNSQMMQAYQAGKYAECIQAARDCLEIHKQLHGNQHSEYATSLNNLGVLHKSLGNYEQAEPLFCEAMVIWEKVLGKQHPSYANGLNNLATLYTSMGDYQRAELQYHEAIAIWEKVLGKEHSSYAESQQNLAVLYFLMGDFPRAEPLFREAIAILERVLGKQHPHYVSSLHNLGGLYASIGDYSRAESLFREALVLREKVLGKLHPDYATSLESLAELYKSMADYSQAEPMYREAMSIQEKVLGKQHPDYAITLNNLAELYRLLGDYSQAEPLYREAMAIQEKVLGKQHPEYANTLNNLAELYRLLGDFSQAEQLYRETMAIREKVLGKQHPEFGQSLNNLGSLYYSMGDYPRAEPLCHEAIEIVENTMGKQHPDYAQSLNNLALLYVSMGDYARAEPLFREAVEISLRNLELTADVQSQRQQVAMGESLRYQLDNYLSLAMQEPKFQEGAYAALLRWKGSVWQRQQRQRLLVDQPSLKPRFAELNAVSSKLSALILSIPNPQQRDAWHRQLDELTDQREQLERNLSLASVEFRQTTTPVTPEQLRAGLPKGTMLVDFLEYKHFTPANQKQQTKGSWERRLLVHLVRADQEVRSIDLGAVEPLNELVQTWRRDFGQSVAAAEAAKELRQRIWEPLAESLSGISTVYVSPDGLLGQFPLGALPGKDSGTYLLEEMAIIMLPVPQGLPEMVATPPQPYTLTIDGFCLVGGVDYDQLASPEECPQPKTPASAETAPTNPAPLMLAVRGSEHEQYRALPGTIAEIETIESLIRKSRPAAQATILRGSSASESAFARLAPGHRYLHVATHGFFAPESVKNALTASSPDTTGMLGGDDSRSPRTVGSHPDLLSGLVFAGANQSKDVGAEDGILTAAEVQSLDLRGVELAILSACETGLGKTAGGEGIIGLQRAFQLSGAKTTITSLWQVDDAATQALMVEFYRNLFERKLSKLESLRQAQIWMLNHPDAIEGKDLSTRGDPRKVKPIAAEAPTAKSTRSLPAYWAAFQLSGDPR